MEIYFQVCMPSVIFIPIPLTEMELSFSAA